MSFFAQLHHCRSRVIQAILFSSSILSSTLLFTPPAQAATSCTFNGPGANWSDAANWSCGAVPGSGFTGDVIIATNKSVTANSSVSLDQNMLTINSGGRITMAAGANVSLTFKNVQNNGTLNINNGNTFNANTGFNNVGTLFIASGGKASTLGSGLLNNGFINCAGSLTIEGMWSNVPGSTFIDASTGIIRLSGTVNQTIPAGTYLSTFRIEHTSGIVYLGGEVTVPTITISSILDIGSYTLHVTQDLQLSATFVQGTGTVDFNGTGNQNLQYKSDGLPMTPTFLVPVTISNVAQSVYINTAEAIALIFKKGLTIKNGSRATMSVLNNVYVDTAFINSGTIDTNGTFTCQAACTNNGTMTNENIFTINQSFTNNGTLGASGSSIFNFSSANKINVSGFFKPQQGTIQVFSPIDFTATVEVDSLNINSGTVSLLSNGTFNKKIDLQGNGASLSLAANQTITVPVISNTNGLIQLGSNAKIMLPAVVQLTSAANSTLPAQGYTAPTNAYVYVEDDNRNLNGSVFEAINVEIKAAANIGGDSETVQLVQDVNNPKYGRFFSSALPISLSNNSLANNGKLEVTGSGIITLTYTDPSDPTDVQTKTITVTTQQQIQQPADVKAPVISFNTPAHSETISGSKTISVTATDENGIASMSITANGTPISLTNNTSPYTATWNTANVSNGAYTLVATATDPSNNQGTASISVTVNNQVQIPQVQDVTPPTVSFTSPVNGATLSGTTSLVANGQDNIAVTNYTFELAGSGGGIIASGSNNSQSWNTVGVPNGNYTLKVTAYDGANNHGSATVSIIVNNQQNLGDTTPPTISFPGTMNTTVSGSAVPFTTSATDNVGVTKVEFRIDGNLIDTVLSAPFDTIWDASGATNVGTHTLTATAYDAANNSAIASVQITVTAQGQGADTTPPVVSFISPTNGATVSGTNVTIKATGTDNNGTPILVFKADTVTLPTNPVTPDMVVWDTTQYANGNHQLSVTATDAANNSTTAVINVIVQNGTADTEKPIVSITSPLDGATVSSVVKLEATASDNVGVEGVTFKVNGIPVGNEIPLGGTSFSTTWNSATFANGDYVISAVARDAANNSKSTSITVTVSNAVQENNLQNTDTSVPKVSITSPKNGATVSGSAVSLLATATDNVGVVGVFFEIDQILLGSEISTQPYAKTWDSTTVANGEHTFTVTAYDLGNNVVTASVKFNVANQEQAKVPVYPVYTGSNSYTQPQQAQYTLAQFQALQVSGGAVHKLIKLPDDGNPTTQEDTTVYYIGADGKRHAFTNSKVFFTWYCGFDDVITITPEAMATLPLGKNITYHPGVRMVKFISNPQVYAVTGSGVLRPITTEAVATALYGATWNKAIDDIADAFYTDYTVNPTAITSVTDYNVASAIQTARYPSDVMNVSGYTPTTGLHPFVCAAPIAPPAAGQDASLDSDNDGVKNGEEVNVYGTDPLKKDTDGDGFSDYQEIMNGYNPLGAGKCTTNKCIVK